MDSLHITLFGICLLFFILSIIGQRAAYYNGCCDGYGFGKESSCPGYKRAGDYLRKHMSHRWYELRMPERKNLSGNTTYEQCNGESGKLDFEE